MKTFFFRDHYFFGINIEKSGTDSKEKPFFYLHPKSGRKFLFVFEKCYKIIIRENFNKMRRKLYPQHFFGWYGYEYKNHNDYVK